MEPFPQHKGASPPPGQAAETCLLPGAGGITSEESSILGPQEFPQPPELIRLCSPESLVLSREGFTPHCLGFPAGQGRAGQSSHT